ncbi:hypothetical protein [Rhizobium laguerreae]|uniref:hypothetical protein n=1 Tax=Rhizobium laguerreae TaxID=1076926 RepID=UPI0021B121A4|nr:hypothetical protein [Rhizobium laguerreae]
MGGALEIATGLVSLQLRTNMKRHSSRLTNTAVEGHGFSRNPLLFNLTGRDLHLAVREISFGEKYLAGPRVRNHYSVCTIACGETLIARMRDRGKEDQYLAVIPGKLFASSPVFSTTTAAALNAGLSLTDIARMRALSSARDGLWSSPG